jgi:hypothetical protein
MSTLPVIEDLETQHLPQLAQLHLSSAASLMATVKLLAPTAFAAGASSPDELLLSKLDSSLLNMVSCLIELQLFHLQRASKLATSSRRRMQLVQALAGSQTCNSTPCSSNRSSCESAANSSS